VHCFNESWTFHRGFATIDEYNIMEEILNVAKSTSLFHDFDATIIHLDIAQRNFRFFFFSQTSYWNARDDFSSLLEILLDFFSHPQFKVRAKADQTLRYFFLFWPLDVQNNFLKLPKSYSV
jgi:hypothetical protein